AHVVVHGHLRSAGSATGRRMLVRGWARGMARELEEAAGPQAPDRPPRSTGPLHVASCLLQPPPVPPHCRATRSAGATTTGGRSTSWTTPDRDGAHRPHIPKHCADQEECHPSEM